jgi:hypothetical protein
MQAGVGFDFVAQVQVGAEVSGVGLAVLVARAASALVHLGAMSGPRRINGSLRQLR